MTTRDGYPAGTRHEYPGRGARDDFATARLAGETAGLGLRAAEAQLHPFDWGIGGVSKLIRELATSDGRSPIVRAGTKYVVGNLSPNSQPLASHDLSTFAPEGTPSRVDELRAVVLHGDKAWAVVTSRIGDDSAKFSVGLVELGFGSNNPGCEGVKGRCVARADNLEVGDNDPLNGKPSEAYSIEHEGVRVTFQAGQVMVEPFGDKAGGMSIVTAMTSGLAESTTELANLLQANTLMWSIDSTDHAKILGVRY